MELEQGVNWSDLSAEQQEYVKNQSSMNTHAIGEILAIPPGSKLETEEIKQLKSNYSNISFIYNKNTLSGVLAQVPHEAWGDRRGLINRVAFSNEIHFFGLTMSNFSRTQTVTSELRRAGYHQPVRAGKRGLFDLVNHEIAHTVNQTNAIGKTGADFRKLEESRADDFLKKMRR